MPLMHIYQSEIHDGEGFLSIWVCKVDIVVGSVEVVMVLQSGTNLRQSASLEATPPVFLITAMLIYRSKFC